MNENYQYPSADRNEVPHRELLLRWLKLLLYIQIAGILFSWASFLPVRAFEWASPLVNVCTIVALFALGTAGKRYRKAAVFSTVSLGCSLFVLLLSYSAALLRVGNLLASAITLAASICSIIAGYQEYYGHADVAQGLEEKLAGKWRSLFLWQLLVGLAAGGLSTVVAVLVVFLPFDGVQLTAVFMVVLKIVTTLISVFYLIYLKRMLDLLRG